MDDFRRLEIMKLASMTDFVLNFSKTNQTSDEFENIITDYAEFLKQPLILGMFIPVDDQGNVIKEPDGYRYFMQDDENGAYEGDDLKECYSYQKAKEKVVFKGFELHKDDKGEYLQSSYDAFEIGYLDRAPNVEYAAIGYELTESAIKHIGL